MKLYGDLSAPPRVSVVGRVHLASRHVWHCCGVTQLLKVEQVPRELMAENLIRALLPFTGLVSLSFSGILAMP